MATGGRKSAPGKKNIGTPAKTGPRAQGLVHGLPPYPGSPGRLAVLGEGTALVPRALMGEYCALFISHGIGTLAKTDASFYQLV